jgi:archaellum component FlaC
MKVAALVTEVRKQVEEVRSQAKEVQGKLNNMRNQIKDVQQVVGQVTVDIRSKMITIIRETVRPILCAVQAVNETMRNQEGGFNFLIENNRT